jgi:hypothetical protein
MPLLTTLAVNLSPVSIIYTDGNMPPVSTTPLVNNDIYYHIAYTLKVFTNEKRGGLRVISFDRSSFKLFLRKFSKKSVQAPSCKRPRTAPRTLFVSFASNNCFQTAV